MATTSDIDVTEGASPTAHVATFDITEDAETKKVQRIAITDSAGADLSGTKADAKSSATDTTAVSWTSVFKQISASIQAAAASLAGTLTVGTHAVTGSGNFASTVADGADATLGAKADAKSTATDTTAISAMSVFKQISASIQALVTAFGTAWTRGAGASDANTQRVTVDSGQLAALATAYDVLNNAGGGQKVYLPTDQPWAVGTVGFMKKEDIASADGDAGIPAMAIQKATPADTAGTDGDYAMLQIKDGRLYTRATIEDISNGDYEVVPASSGPNILGGSGAAGDYLGSLLVIPTTTSPGSVTITDGSNSPDIAIPVFAGGASSLSNLVPFIIAVGIKSQTGGWRVTTGAGLSVLASGNFT